MKKQTKKTIVDVVFSVVGIVIGALLALPFFWMLIASLYPSSDMMFVVPMVFPNPIRLRNYVEIFLKYPILRQFGNTLVILVFNMIFSICASVSIAYGLARFRVRESGLWFGIMLSTMMLPWVVTLVPSYVIYSKLGIVNTYLPLILPAIGGNVFYVFMLRQYLMGIPRSLDEAAKIDGCGKFRILLQILLPNCVPILVTMVIYSFNGLWADYVGPSIYILNEDRFTLALGLLAVKERSATSVPQWHYIMAFCTLYSVPMILIYLFAQKFYVNAVVASGLKD